MSFKNSEENQEIEFPSLIDMVFLLLVFFMATLSLSSSGNPTPTTGPPQRPFDLPEAKGETSVSSEEIIKTLTIQIEHLDAENAESPKALYFLWPDRDHPVSEKQVYEQVKSELHQLSPDSSHFAVLPRNYLALTDSDMDTCRAFKLIEENIRKYKDDYFAQPSSSNTIEIRAVRDTEFQIINFIMNQCSRYGNLIPKITFRVLSAKEPEKEGSGGV